MRSILIRRITTTITNTKGSTAINITRKTTRRFRDQDLIAPSLRGTAHAHCATQHLPQSRFFRKPPHSVHRLSQYLHTAILSGAFLGKTGFEEFAKRGRTRADQCRLSVHSRSLSSFHRSGSRHRSPPVSVGNQLEPLSSRVLARSCDLLSAAPATLARKRRN